MSSTNRSNARETHVSDYYITPINKIVEFLSDFNKHEDIFRKDVKILDCCAGGDEKHLMSYPEALKQIKANPHNIFTVDIRKDSLADVKGDYLTLDCKNKYDIIITNPPFNCYSDDTEIKTKDGWKKYTEILPDDEVLSCNIDTQKLEWSKINYIIEKDVDEVLINFKHRFLDMMVTKDHRMFTYSKSNYKPQRKDGDVFLAKDINSSSYMPMTGYKWEGTEESDFVLPGCYVSDGQKDVWHNDIHINMIDWAKFLGVWTADGYYRDTLNSQGNQRYTCGIKQSEATSSYIREILSKLPFNYKEYRESGTDKINFEIHSKQLWVHMKQFGKSQQKFVPDYIKENSNEVLQAFIDAYIYGDSTQNNCNSIKLSSISMRLMEDIQEILLKLGYLTNIRKQVLQYKDKDYPIYSINFGKNKTTQNRKFYCKDKKYKQYVPYKGKVFCLNLEKNHFFLLRRNGYEFFSGNCAREIINKALDDVKDGGCVIMLLRLNYLGGKLRKDLWDKHMPSYIFVHNRRMSFTDNGKTDSIEYAHYVWKKGEYPKFSKLMVI